MVSYDGIQLDRAFALIIFVVKSSHPFDFLRFGSVGFTHEFRAALILPNLDDYASPSWLIAFKFMREFPFLLSDSLFLRFGSKAPSIRGVWSAWTLSALALKLSCEPFFELFRMLSRTMPVYRL